MCVIQVTTPTCYFAGSLSTHEARKLFFKVFYNVSFCKCVSFSQNVALGSVPYYVPNSSIYKEACKEKFINCTLHRVFHEY